MGTDQFFVESSEKRIVGILNKIGLATAITGLITPALYLLGLSFYQGDLAAHGVNSDPFPLNGYDTFVSAFYAIGYTFIGISKGVIWLLSFLLSDPGIYWFSGIDGSIILIKYLCIRFKWVEITKLKIRGFTFFQKVAEYFHWEKNRLVRAAGSVSVTTYAGITILYVLILVPLFWFAIPLIGYYSGFNEAKLEIYTYLSDGCIEQKNSIWTNCKVLKNANGDVVFEGILVVQNQNYIAFLNDKGSFVRQFPKSGYIENSLKPKTSEQENIQIN